MSSSPKPRRFVRMFQPRFARLVEAQVKLQTVRPTPKRRPQVGDILDAREWTGKPYRSKQRLLLESRIIEVKEIEIYGSNIFLNGRRLTSDLRELFAQQDGFADFAEMAAWFQAQHGLPFKGVVIYWEAKAHE